MGESGPDAHRHASRNDYEPGLAGLSSPAVPSQGASDHVPGSGAGRRPGQPAHPPAVREPGPLALGLAGETQADVVVHVVGVVVAIRRSAVLRIVVPTTAAFDAVRAGRGTRIQADRQPSRPVTISARGYSPTRIARRNPGEPPISTCATIEPSEACSDASSRSPAGYLGDVPAGEVAAPSDLSAEWFYDPG
jgi:hypothetical protein